jgi:hypothetical protein
VDTGGHGAYTLLLELRADRQAFEPITDVPLDADGTGEVQLPPAELRLALAPILADQNQ